MKRNSNYQLLRRGLTGYLILIAPHAFIFKCHDWPDNYFHLWHSSRYQWISNLLREFYYLEQSSILTVYLAYQLFKYDFKQDTYKNIRQIFYT